jgi:hypothetical protein
LRRNLKIFEAALPEGKIDEGKGTVIERRQHSGKIMLEDLSRVADRWVVSSR